MVVALSGCERRTKPAEIIYKPKAPITKPGGSGVDVGEIGSTPTRPNVTLPSQEIVIGLLAPLTGPQAEIGGQLRDAALMGLYEAIQQAPRLDAAATPKLLIRDSGQGGVSVEQATEELVQSGAQVIVGPLISQHVVAAGKVARRSGVPLIAFSNNVKVATPNVFVFGYVPWQQVKRISDFAAEQKIKHYSTIAQQDDYGRMVVREFSRNLATHGHTVQPVEFFSPGQMPPSPVMSRVAEDAANLGRERKAVFLPVTGKALSAISTRFMQDIQANNGFLKLIGTGLWDNPQTLNDPGLKGAWFATTDPNLSYEFNQRFYEQYAYAPSRIASLAYDSVSLLAGRAITKGAQGLSFTSLLENPSYSTQANGEIRLRSNGLVDRALAVVEVGDQGFRIIDPPKFAE